MDHDHPLHGASICTGKKLNLNPWVTGTYITSCENVSLVLLRLRLQTLLLKLHSASSPNDQKKTRVRGSQYIRRGFLPGALHIRERKILTTSRGLANSNERINTSGTYYLVHVIELKADVLKTFKKKYTRYVLRGTCIPGKTSGVTLFPLYFRVLHIPWQ